MNAVMLLTNWAEKIPSEKTILLQKELANLDDSAALALSAIPLKDPVLGILLSVFFGVFGVDRFYKGDFVLGVLKLLLGWLTFGIWWLLDCFLVYRGIKEDNFQKILNALMLCPKNAPALPAQNS